jgi:hypothetical protein
VRIAGSVDYLQTRGRRRAATALTLVLSGIVLVVLGFVTTQTSSAGVLSSILALSGFGALVMGTIQAGAARRDAEAAAAEGPLLVQLQARLSDDYLFVRRVKLPAANTEVDAVLLGPHGVLVLGLYSKHGVFGVRADDWFEIEGRRPEVTSSAGEITGGVAGNLEQLADAKPLRESPTWALTRSVRAMQRIAREEGLVDLPVHGAVVLSRGVLAVADRPSLAVVPLARIASYVEYLRPEDPEAVRAAVIQLGDVLTAHVERERR